MMVRQEILGRLACAKYIFTTGIDTLDKGAPYASGLAVLAFQDAAEMVLRAIAEHLHAQIKETTAFHQIIDEIDKASSVKLTHRSALNQLNKARVNFKHLGLAPRDEDVRKFRGDLEGFFPSALKDFLDIDYDRLSLVSLIRHHRTRNWMEKSERALSDGDHTETIINSAVAMQLCLQTRARGYSRHGLQNVARFNPDRSTMGIASAMKDLAEAAQERLSEIYRHLDLIGHGVAYGDYQRFLSLTPGVFFTMNGKPHLNLGSSAPYQPDESLFCFAFAQNTILKLQSQYTPGDVYGPRATGRKLMTTTQTQVIVYPAKPGEEPEVLFDLPPDSLLEECAASYKLDAFLPVLVDGECAYISKESVRYIASKERPDVS